MQTVRGFNGEVGRVGTRTLPHGTGKKTAQVVIEKDSEINRILRKAAEAKNADLEAWETSLRAAVLKAGAEALRVLLRDIGSGKQRTSVKCSCGTSMQSKGVKDKTLLTILGSVTFSRSMFQCPTCDSTRYPGDEELDIIGTSRSPGLRRMMARAGSRSTFKEGRDDIHAYAGIKVSAKDVERVAEAIGSDMEQWSHKERKTNLLLQTHPQTQKPIPVLYVCYDGTGVPMTKQEVKGRKGKQPDGTAETREAKLGCVFTQTTTDFKGFPIRDPDSTTFVGAIETSEHFGWRIYGETVRRGLHQAQRVVVIGDGAIWIKSIAEMHFPDAIQIIDLYHTREHISDLCKLLFPTDEKKLLKYRMRWWTDLDNSNIEKILREAKWLRSIKPQVPQEANKEIQYLEKNKERMRYGDFRKQGLFVGSGVVEAGCKSIIGQRLKQSGMEWSVRGANSIISLRCMMKSRRLEDYWESRCG